MKHFYNESANSIEIYDVQFDTNGPSNLVQWLVWKAWRHAPAYVTQEITLRRAYVT